MQLSYQQQAIVSSGSDAKINAVAGAGKTTTLREYARKRSRQRLLYIGFNRTVKDEAINTFLKHGISNTRIETAHSLAYSATMKGGKQKLRANGYKTAELAERMTFQGTTQDRLAVANHVGKFITLFCNSTARKVQELNYLDFVSDKQARQFVELHYGSILTNTRLILEGMLRGKFEVIHDFYLKLFQLGNPVLDYDAILFDEGQDASPVMLDVFLRQSGTKVIVGDSHQQIYGWRYAINSLRLVDYPSFDLNTSYRFPGYIAQLASSILQVKNQFGIKTPMLEGNGTNESVRGQAVIGRTNVGILVKAIEYLIEKAEIDSLYFEGNFNSYVYSDAGGSLYDVLNLFLCKNGLIRDPLIASMGTFRDLQDYIELTEDRQLALLVEVVQKYGNDLPMYLAIIRNHLSPSRDMADCIFSTVHRSKGMEYRSVEICDDFAGPDDIEKVIAYTIANGHDAESVLEEVNALYVTVTRTTRNLKIPTRLVPADFVPTTPHIELIESKSAGSGAKQIEDQWNQSPNRWLGSPARS